MPFCPNCRFEYEEGITTCPDCNQKLVESLGDNVLPASDQIGPDDWIPLAQLTSQQHAEMIMECLQEKDIPSVLRSGVGHFGATGQMGPSSFAPAGGVYILFVPQDFVIVADREAGLIMGSDWEKSRLVDLDEG